MAKKIYCNTCDHECHCVGKGYYVSSNKCSTCICDKCDCKPRIFGVIQKESLWQKFVNWLWK
jgi:hypothetical protein